MLSLHTVIHHCVPNQLISELKDLHMVAINNCFRYQHKQLPHSYQQYYSDSPDHSSELNAVIVWLLAEV